jgi:hypothetical protein
MKRLKPARLRGAGAVSASSRGGADGETGAAGAAGAGSAGRAGVAGVRLSGVGSFGLSRELIDDCDTGSASAAQFVLEI